MVFRPLPGVRKESKEMEVQRKVRFNKPARPPIRNYRKGSKRGKLIGLLSRPEGATFNEIMEEIGWEYKVAYENVVLVNTYTGYGLSEGDDGRIRIVAAD
jgi:hypothetical protein